MKTFFTKVQAARDLVAYNLEITEIHTYYAGVATVLVHNSCSPLETQAKGRATPLTTSKMQDLAIYIGYGKRTNEAVKGERNFANGKDFVVQNTTSHNGGIWKIGKSVGDLRKTGAYGNHGRPTQCDWKVNE